MRKGMAHTATRRHKRVRVELCDGTVMIARFHDRNDRSVWLKDEDGKDIKLVRGSIRSLSDYKPMPHELQAAQHTSNTNQETSMSTTQTNTNKNKGGLLGGLLRGAGVRNESKSEQHPRDEMIRVDVFDTAPSVAVGVVSVLGVLRRSTVTKLATMLEGRATSEEIEAALRAAVSKGVVSRHRDEYTMSNKQSDRHLNEIRRNAPTEPAKFELKEPNVGAPDARGVVSLSDGIDLCVWKIMQDRKWRSREEIFRIAMEFGQTDRKAWNDRITTLVVHKWFDTEQCNPQRYRLRKSVQMPKSEQIVPAPSFKPESATYPQDKLKGAAAVNPITETAAAAEPTAATAHSDQQILATDNIRQAIWKVMSDYQSYETSEIELLLSDAKFNPKTVSATMTKLNQAGWFDREEQVVTGRRRFFRYTLRDSVAYPADTAPVVAPEAETPATTEQATLPGMTNQQQDNNMKTQVTKHTAGGLVPQAAAIPEAPRLGEQILPVEADLISIKISLKGMQYSLAEATDLVRELYANGYGPEFQRPTRLFETKVVIRGQEFSREELTTIVKTLRNEGVALK